MNSLKAACTHYAEGVGYRYCFNGQALFEVAGPDSDIAWRGLVPEKLSSALQAVRVGELSSYSDLKEEWVQ